jgi:large subunit ribosomal protein L25
MERLELEASKRQVTGKKVRFLRREGITPANLYGHGVKSVALQVDTKQMQHALAKTGKTDLIQLKIEGSKTAKNVLVRKVQENAITDELLHVDFYQVKMTEKIKTDVPLTFIGDAPVLKNKNVTLLHLLDSLHIEALPDALPHSLEVDLSNLAEIDQTIHVRDIPLSSDVTLHTDPDQMVVKITETRRGMEEEVTEVPAEEIVAEAEAPAAVEPEEPSTEAE